VEGLCAIAFRTGKLYQEFLKSNSSLKASLTTWWPDDTHVLWLRPTDFKPANITFDDLTWVSEGIIPVAASDQLVRHFISQDGPVVCVPFAELKWPSQAIQGCFEVIVLERTFGPRYRQLGPRKVVLNGAFWGHFLARKLGVTYHVQKEAFIRSVTLRAFPWAGSQIESWWKLRGLRAGS
jgi:hypothetical protein